MTLHEQYCSQMKERGLEATMSEAELHKALGINKESTNAPFVARKSSTARNVRATLNNHISEAVKKPKKPKAEAPPKVPKPKYRTPKLYTDEELRVRRSAQRKAKREELKAQGKTMYSIAKMKRLKKESISNTPLLQKVS
jgi:hypothetical protein